MKNRELKNPNEENKVTQNEHIYIFYQVLSDLTQEQKLIVQKLGFGSLLHITCDCNFDDLFRWLALHFNTSTCRTELNNGFEFSFNKMVVHKILGIPCGGIPMHTNPSRQTIDLLNSILKTTSPSPEVLLTMISDNMTEESFSRIFMLLVLSTIIAPTSKGVFSKKYFSALVDVSSVAQYNWCLFTLSFLVAHFEFLITSEYKIPTNIFPGLPLWSITMLRSFIALDTTPVMKILGKNITNSIPTMESYVDDAMSLFDSSITSIVTKKFAPLTVPVLTPMQLDNIASKPAETSLIQENITLGTPPDLQRILNSFQFLDFPGPHIYPPSFYRECSQAAIDSIIENFSKSLLIDDSIKFDSLMTFGSTSTSGLNVVETFRKDLVSEINCNSLYCPFKINYGEREIRVASPLNDPELLKLMEDFEAECRRNELQVENKKKYEHICPAKFVPQSIYIQFQQVIFSSPVQAEFYKTMTAALTVLDSRIFQVNEVLVDQKTLTISLRLGCWMNPHSLDCYSKMLNTDQIIRGRKGLIPNTDVTKHTVQREDMQRIVITANLESRRFFDIMNPDASGKDKFTSIISTVCYNFKSLFALSYPNCTAYAIKDFDYMFIAVPRTHFRYDTCVFILLILKTYRGMGVLGFTTVDLQALREIFLYEITTYNNSEVQLPIVTKFLQNHGF
ncbi:hypothetical protein ZWY2020_047942 [Hordeum vulgare]|nr:hypothetical protein ZWY2020_047942 [Hordeum vulgare]